MPARNTVQEYSIDRIPAGELAHVFGYLDVIGHPYRIAQVGPSAMSGRHLLAVVISMTEPEHEGLEYILTALLGDLKIARRKIA